MNIQNLKIILTQMITDQNQDYKRKIKYKKKYYQPLKQMVLYRGYHCFIRSKWFQVLNVQQRLVLLQSLKDNLSLSREKTEKKGISIIFYRQFTKSCLSFILYPLLRTISNYYLFIKQIYVGDLYNGADVRELFEVLISMNLKFIRKFNLHDCSFTIRQAELLIKCDWKYLQTLWLFCKVDNMALKALMKGKWKYFKQLHLDQSRLTPDCYKLFGKCKWQNLKIINVSYALIKDEEKGKLKGQMSHHMFMNYISKGHTYYLKAMKQQIHYLAVNLNKNYVKQQQKRSYPLRNIKIFYTNWLYNCCSYQKYTAIKREYGFLYKYF